MKKVLFGLGAVVLTLSSSALGDTKVPALPFRTDASGCVPVNQPISIVASNVYFDKVTLLAGNVPSGASAGTVSLAGPGATSTKSDGSIVIQRDSSDAVIQLVATPACKVVDCKQVNLTGTIMIKPLALQDLLSRFGGSVDSAAPTTCVSGVAIEGGVSMDGKLYGAQIYLYLNNTQSGYTLQAKQSGNMNKAVDAGLVQMAGLEDSISTAARAL